MSKQLFASLSMDLPEGRVILSGPWAQSSESLLTFLEREVSPVEKECVRACCVLFGRNVAELLPRELQSRVNRALARVIEAGRWPTFRADMAVIEAALQSFLQDLKRHAPAPRHT